MGGLGAEDCGLRAAIEGPTTEASFAKTLRGRGGHFSRSFFKNRTILSLHREFEGCSLSQGR